MRSRTRSTNASFALLHREASSISRSKSLLVRCHPGLSSTNCRAQVLLPEAGSPRVSTTFLGIGFFGERALVLGAEGLPDGGARSVLLPVEDGEQEAKR